jgi:HPt (histidine-containing phosphotransfer) domain-containing protein
VTALAERKEATAERSRIVVRLDGDLEPIVTRFLGRKRGELAVLRNAVQAREFETIRRLGHDLKGAGEGFGFPDLSAIGAQLERCAHTRDAKAITEQIEAMEAYLTALEVRFS